MTMKAFVTGSAGFVGRHMVESLVERGYDVSLCDLTTLPSFPADTDDALFQFRNDTTVYDLVVHCAAQTPHRAAIDSQPASHVYNQLLDAAMFDWTIRTRQRRVLYLSSCAVLDEEPDDYGNVKLVGERMARQARAAGVPVTVVRPYSGYGEDQSPDFPFGAFRARALRREDPFLLWNANAVRDWIHIDDVVNGALAVAEADVAEPVSLCTGIGTSCRDVAALMCKAAGYSPHIVGQNDKPAGVTVRIGNPQQMNQYYTAKVSIEEGVARALR